MALTSIIIPSYNGRSLLEECIRAIRVYTNVPYEIFVIDDGSSDRTIDYCRHEKINCVSLPVNKGFPVACNYGMKLATGDSIVLLNNDVVVTHNWLSNMLACLYSSNDIGIVGPRTNYASGKQQLDADYVNLDDFHQGSVHFNQPNSQLWQPMERIVGLCFLIKRELMGRIGFLDERFSPGHYEDDDYCYRARLAGYRLMMAGDVRVHHYGSASFKKQKMNELEQLVTGNHAKFMEKWGVDPLQFI